MPSDGGFERKLVNKLNNKSNGKYFAKRFKQSRFTSQITDVVVFSDKEEYYYSVECKTKKVDTEKLNKDNNTTEGKIYFSQHFSQTEDGHQIENFQDFLEKSHMKGVLAVAYRKGRGRKVEYWALDFDLVVEKFRNGDSGITKPFVEENGIEMFDRKENGKIKDYDFQKVFEV